ncbi:cytochrome P450 [Colletotrichum tamarilloi]|uniref:Cytochrome P450 n=1 Tax=Colletotrichum tamarilloi TaxID=1209934 RepID=A0ABQ9QV05_9PEZI|nr:cytochrome P450 [Colletotrichum tamarilloi]KAK1485983.1 cytochrome P450 [Colletotrichum tamarilloi]
MDLEDIDTNRILSPQAIVLALLLGYSIYVTGLITYRLYFSPIAHIPGSKLTAATGWYETYLDVFKGGQFTFQIEEWHRQYGPIVRITPWEVHIADPDFYEVLFNNKTRYSKIEKLRYRFGLHLSSFDTIDHAHHHLRRSAISPFFAKQKVAGFSSQMQSMADKMVDRLATGYSEKVKPVNMNEAYAAFILNPLMVPVFRFHNEVKDQIIKVISGQNTSNKGVQHRTVFHELLQSNLPPEELSVERLKHEAASITGAGIDTTKTTLALATFHILDNPSVFKRLREELKTRIPRANEPMPPLHELESLPFLNAVVQESLRLAFGITQRLSRISPDGPITYGSYVIPPNVPFSMTSYIQHRDPKIYPEPDVFRPERWLENQKTASGKPLSRYLVPFGKGPRMCLGMNFAMAELYIGLATVFRRLDIELYDTGRDAVDMAADYFVPIPKEGTQGVRVMVIGTSA